MPKFLHTLQIRRGEHRDTIAINPYDVSRIDAIVGASGPQSRVYLRNGTSFDVDGTVETIVAELHAMVETSERGW